MRNLLRANFFRMRRDEMFWTCFGVVLACSAVFMFFWCREDLSLGLAVKLEEYYFNMVMALGLFDAMFAAMFLNAEYAEGTVRNKLAAGHTRRDIYLAHFLTVLAASLLIMAAWLAAWVRGHSHDRDLGIRPRRLGASCPDRRGLHRVLCCHLHLPGAAARRPPRHSCRGADLFRPAAGGRYGEQHPL